MKTKQIRTRETGKQLLTKGQLLRLRRANIREHNIKALDVSLEPAPRSRVIDVPNGLKCFR